MCCVIPDTSGRDRSCITGHRHYRWISTSRGIWQYLDATDATSEHIGTLGAGMEASIGSKQAHEPEVIRLLLISFLESMRLMNVSKVSEDTFLSRSLHFFFFCHHRRIVGGITRRVSTMEIRSQMWIYYSTLSYISLHRFSTRPSFLHTPQIHTSIHHRLPPLLQVPDLHFSHIATVDEFNKHASGENQAI